ncbi:hypothetical protein FBALC1_05688 [Flavobacteriales bacterium ALC-1]|nr:hypothetical protein FBALC1_05688 [Flavobacteriales bacterium ALC-1]
MNFDIIENNYLRNHKYWFIYKWILFVLIGIFILKSFGKFDYLSEDNLVWDITFLSLMVLSLFNTFYYTRVGKFKIANGNIEIKYNEKARYFKYYKSEKILIDLKKIKTAKLWSVSNNQFILKLDNNIQTTISANKTQIEIIKAHLIKSNILIYKTDFISSVKRWLK